MNGFINEKNPTFSTIISSQRNSRAALTSFVGSRTHILCSFFLEVKITRLVGQSRLLL